MKQAILAVSFGTTYAQAEEECILPVETALKNAYPGWDVYRAYTAKIVMKRLRERGKQIDDVPAALEKLRKTGYGKIVLASAHMIPGTEYEALREAAQGYPVSEPLLAGEEDLNWMAALMQDITRQEGMPVLFMGHGTDHAADETYVRLQEKLPEGTFLACVEGAHRLETILPQLEKMRGREITLAPLMLVAGDHAHNDLAGTGEDSWKSILEAAGFRVHIRMRGLGAEEQVQQRFCEKTGRIIC